MVFFENESYFVENFPDNVVIPTTSELGITAFNRSISQRVFPLGLSNQSMSVDGDLMDPSDFFRHDLNHVSAFIKYKTHYTSGIEDKFNINLYDEFQKLNLSLEQREMVENIYFLIWHENEIMIQSNVKIKKFSDEEKRYFTKRFQREGDLREVLPDSVNADSKEEVLKYLEESVKLFDQLTLQIINSLR